MNITDLIEKILRKRDVLRVEIAKVKRMNKNAPKWYAWASLRNEQGRQSHWSYTALEALQDLYSNWNKVTPCRKG